MDQEGVTREEFNELLELTKKNNKLLRQLHSQATASFWSGLLLWIVIIAAWLLAYYYLYPYIVPYLNIIRTLGANASTTPSQLSLPSPAEIQAFLHLASTTKP